MPAPPAPDARFRILDIRSEQRISQARSTGNMGHVLATVLLAQAGERAEAVAELDMFPTDLRNSRPIARLIETSQPR